MRCGWSEKSRAASNAVGENTDMRKIIVCGLLALVRVAQAAEPTGVIPVYADNYSKLMYYQAELKGFPEQIPPRGGEPWGTQKWTSPEQTMSWRASVAQAGQYAVAMLYLCKAEEAGSEFEISSGNSRLTGLTRNTGNAWRNPGWDRQEMRGALRLAAGENKIGLRIVKRAGTGTGEIIQMRALELILPAVRKSIEARAARQHPSTRWMVDAKYGLMTHWTPRTQPRHGPQKPYCEAVRDFDVEAYMHMIEETGAGYLVFTTGWGGFWFPGPIQAINSKMPGHGCERDLVMDIADALHKRGKKLILYWGWTPGRDYATAWGQEFAEFAKGLSGFLEEVGQRYGTKVDGFFFDGGYESRLYPNPFPYEMVTKAARTGNPNRVVSYNNWIFPNSLPSRITGSANRRTTCFRPPAPHPSPREESRKACKPT